MTSHMVQCLWETCRHDAPCVLKAAPRSTPCHAFSSDWNASALTAGHCRVGGGWRGGAAVYVCAGKRCRSPPHGSSEAGYMQHLVQANPYLAISDPSLTRAHVLAVDTPPHTIRSLVAEGTSLQQSPTPDAGVREYARQRSIAAPLPVHRSHSFNRAHSLNRSGSLAGSFTDGNSVSQVCTAGLAALMPASTIR